MSVMLRLRQYHAFLAALVVAAYVSGEWGVIHAWLGYGVALVILVRLVWATTGARQLGLARFYPVFAGLRLGTALTHPAISRTLLLSIALTLLGTTGTGIMMDRGRAISMAETAVVATAHADSGRDTHVTRDNKRDGVLDDVHEALANLVALLVICHVAYVLAFKFPLARFMLFMDVPREKGSDRLAD
jgi:cytochrome b